jgi:hypothetical protein
MKAANWMTRAKALLLGAVTLACTVVFSHQANAATRTVCGESIIPDQRVDCPSSGTGVRRACSPGGNVDAVGFMFEVWDKDAGTGSGDEFIGSWFISGPGQWCITFEWENASYSLGEVNPDVYTVFTNHVTVGGDETVRIVQANGTVYPSASARNGWGGDPDAGTAVECTTAGACWIAGGAGVFVHSNAFSDYGQALMALDSAQRTLSVYTSRLDAGTIDIEYPTDENCPTACAPSATRLLFPTGLADEGFRVAHELGHTVHMHEFNRSTIRDDLSLNGAGWGLTSQENDSGAVAEGWATYVAAASWWDPNNSGSAPSGFGVTYETATPTVNDCSATQPAGGGNRGIPLQVARAFWDLDDANNEAAVAPATVADAASLTTTSISAGWANFADGTGNRQDFESGAHGVNAFDYDFNNNVNDNTLFSHNCIQSQQP